MANNNDTNTHKGENNGSAYNLEEILEVLKDAAFQAGTVIRQATDERTSSSRIVVTTKSSSTDLVTQVDQNCEKLIIRILRANYPQVQIIGEETSDDSYELTDEPTFTIDPIDGTTNFVHGLPLTCVLIAFLLDGRPVVGVTYAPILDEMFFAIHGRGAFMQSHYSQSIGNSYSDNNEKKPQQIFCSPTTQLSQALISMTAGNGRNEESIERFQTVQKAILQQIVRHIRDVGSCGITMAYVACGKLDAALEEGSWSDNTGPKLWDLAAGKLLVQEAGGETRDITHRAFRVKELDLKQRSLFVASTRELTDELLDTIYSTPSATRVKLQSMLANTDEDGTAAAVVRDKLQQMEHEKGETEQVLLNLRGKLEEHKRRSTRKRQRLKEQRNRRQEELDEQTAGAANSSSTVSPQHPSNTNISSNASIANSVATHRSMDDNEVLELEQKIHQLELTKTEMEQTMLDLLSSYESKSKSLQQEQVRMQDDKDTTYKEMKGLLIEQHQESERLRFQVSRVERKRRRFLRTAKRSAAATVIALLSATAYALMGGVLDDWSLLLTSRNHMCAPARPGSQLTHFTAGPIEAPWWAVSYAKPILFALFCADRPRIRLELGKNGDLFIVDRDDPLSLTKKFGDKIYIEAETMHITDRRGGHKEMKAPWAKSETTKSEL